MARPQMKIYPLDSEFIASIEIKENLPKKPTKMETVIILDSSGCVFDSFYYIIQTLLLTVFEKLAYDPEDEFYVLSPQNSSYFKIKINEIEKFSYDDRMIEFENIIEDDDSAENLTQKLEKILSNFDQNYFIHLRILTIVDGDLWSKIQIQNLEYKLTEQALMMGIPNNTQTAPLYTSIWENTTEESEVKQTKDTSNYLGDFFANEVFVNAKILSCSGDPIIFQFPWSETPIDRLGISSDTKSIVWLKNLPGNGQKNPENERTNHKSVENGQKISESEENPETRQEYPENREKSSKDGQKNPENLPKISIKNQENPENELTPKNTNYHQRNEEIPENGQKIPKTVQKVSKIEENSEMGPKNRKNEQKNPPKINQKFFINGVEVEVIIEANLTIKTFQTLLDTKIDFIINQMMSFKSKMGAEIPTERILEYFSMLETQVTKFTSENQLDQRNIENRMRMSRLNAFRERKVASFIEEIVNNNQLGLLNAGQKAIYLRRSRVISKASKGIAKRAMKRSKNSFDEIIRSQVMAMKKNFNEIKDIDCSKHQVSFYSQATTLEGIQTLIELTDDPLFPIYTADEILQLFNLVGVACNGPISDFPDPSSWHILSLYVGCFVSVADIVTFIKQSENPYFVLKTPGGDKEITNVIPIFEDPRIGLFLKKFAPSMVEFSSSIGMRRMIADVPMTFGYTIIAGIRRLMYDLNKNKSTAHCDAFGYFIDSAMTFVGKYFDHIEKLLIDNDDARRSKQNSGRIRHNRDKSGETGHNSVNFGRLGNNLDTFGKNGQNSGKMKPSSDSSVEIRHNLDNISEIGHNSNYSGKFGHNFGKIRENSNNLSKMGQNLDNYSKIGHKSGQTGQNLDNSNKFGHNSGQIEYSLNNSSKIGHNLNESSKIGHNLDSISSFGQNSGKKGHNLENVSKTGHNLDNFGKMKRISDNSSRKGQNLDNSTEVRHKSGKIGQNVDKYHKSDQMKYFSDNSTKMGFYLDNSGIGSMIVPIIRIFKMKKYEKVRQKIPNILRSVYNCEIWRGISKEFKCKQNFDEITKEMLHKLLSIDLEKDKVQVQELFTSEPDYESHNFPDSYKINKEYLNELTQPLYYHNYISLLPKFLTEDIKNVPKMTKASTMKSFGIEYSYDDFIFFNVYQALKYPRSSVRIDSKGLKMKILDVKFKNEVLEDIKAYVRKEFEDFYDYELKMKKKKEEEILATELVHLMINEESYEGLIDLWIKGISKNGQNYKLTNTSSLAFGILTKKVTDLKLSIPLRAEIIKILLLAVDNDGKVVYNKGQIADIKKIPKFKKFFTTTQWDEIEMKLKTKPMHKYREEKPNRHSHGNEKLSYWALGYKNVSECLTKMDQKQKVEYENCHNGCCSLRIIEKVKNEEVLENFEKILKKLPNLVRNSDPNSNLSSKRRNSSTSEFNYQAGPSRIDTKKPKMLKYLPINSITIWDSIELKIKNKPKRKNNDKKKNRRQKRKLKDKKQKNSENLIKSI